MNFSLSVDIRFEGKFRKYFRITELFCNYLVIIVIFCFDLPADRVKFAPYELGIWLECFLVAVYFLVMRIMVFFPVIWGQIRRDWIFWTLFVTAFVLCCIGPGSGICDTVWKIPIVLTAYVMLKFVRKCAYMKWDFHRWRAWYASALIVIGIFSIGYGCKYRHGRSDGACALRQHPGNMDI